MSKTLDRVSKLLAKAENAGTPEEAAAFMAKAQEQASINNIDLAVARMHQAKKERAAEPEDRMLQCNPRSRRHNRKFFLELGMAICDVNDVRYLIGGGDYVLFCTGFPEDLDVVEALYTHLSVQMVTECDEALARGDHRSVESVLLTEKVEIPWEDRDWSQWNGKQYYDDDPTSSGWDLYQRDDETDEEFQARREARVVESREEYLRDVKEGNQIWSEYAAGGYGGHRKPVPPPAFEDVPVLDANGERQYVDKEVSVVDGRVFRSHFYEAFVPRMKGRLWETRRAAERERGVDVATTETALAVRDKTEVVDAAFEPKRAKITRVYESSGEQERKADRSGQGRRSGRKAADVVGIGEGRGVR